METQAYPNMNYIKSKGDAALKNCCGDVEDAIVVLRQDRNLHLYDADYVIEIFNLLCVE